MKAITNLNHLNTDKLLSDDEGRIFIVRKASLRESDQTCSLELLETNEYFTIWTMMLPIAANKDDEFVSKADRSFRFKFFEVNMKKRDLAYKMVQIVENTLGKKVTKDEEIL